MGNAIELIEQRVAELENFQDNDINNSDSVYQRQDHLNYYRGALNELFRLKGKLKKDYLR